MPLQEWTAIPESKVPQVLFSGTEMKQNPPPKKKEAKRKKKRESKNFFDSVNQKQPRKIEFHRKKSQK